MSAEVHRFRVGAFECMAVSDGSLAYAPPMFPPPARLLFCNAPKGLLGRTLREHSIRSEHWMEWTSPYTCLLVNTGEHRVLVDTGAGGLAPTTGKLRQNLQSEGVWPESIDVVILTHGHPDHIGGNTLHDGSLAFSNARYVLWKDEWDFWTSGEAEETLDEHLRDVLLGIARKNLPPIQDRVDLLDREGDILPGVQAIAAPGHTPGHMALAVSSEDECLLCVSDATLHPIHLEQPEWYCVFDLAPERAVASRRRLMDRAAVDNALVLAFHFPFPSLGHVVPKGDGWRWHPITAQG